MLKTRILVGSLVAASYAANIPAPNPPTILKRLDDQPKFKQLITPELSAFAEKYIEINLTPGMSLGVVHVDPLTKAVKTEFGTWGNSTEDGGKVAEETLFAIGSCSKTFVSAAMGILMDDYAQGKNSTPLPPGLSSFTWKTKVQDLFPGSDSDWQLKDPWASEKANMVDILSHVTGLPRHDLSYGPSDTPQDLVKRLRYLKPQVEFREEWLYNNQMYVLGAHIISTYAGKPFKEFVRERIFVPLGMMSTTYSGKEAEKTGNFSQAFSFSGDQTRRIPFFFEDDGVSELIAGPGGVISNTVDMLKWAGVLLNNGSDPITGKNIIPSSAFIEITTAHAIVSDTPVPELGLSLVGYGLGWVSTSMFGHQMLQHDGGLPGFLSLVTLLPSDGVGIVSFVNQGAQLPNVMVANWILFDVFNMSSSPGSPSQMNLTNPIDTATPGGAEPPATISPDLPLETYAGTYSNPGYGTISLCAPTTTSDYCNKTLSDFAKVFPNSPPGSVPALYGTWPRIWTSHFQAIPRGNNSFAITFLELYPEGFGKNVSSFYDAIYQYPANVEFDVQGGEVKGYALFEADAQYPPGNPPPGDLKEVAEVYFVKEA